MDVILLGTGSPLPTPDRAGPATLIRAAGQDILVDCGRGVLMRLAAAGGSPVTLSTVLLTHLHSDHTTDLNDVITSRWAMSPIANPLTVVGPVGTALLVERTLTMLETDIGYRMAHHESLPEPPQIDVVEVTSGVVIDEGGLRVIAEPTDHAPVHPTVGYRFEYQGGAIAIAGDTVPCDGLDRLVAGADVYVQTVIRPDQIALLPFPRIQDVIDYHSSVEQAAATATRGGVRTLLMTHPVPPPMHGTEAEWEDMARSGFSGQVILGADLTKLTV